VTESRVFVDFHNADAKGRLRLNCIGTTRDLARQQVSLHEGLILNLYSDDADERGRPDDLEVSGVVEYSRDEGCWVARIDWSAIRHTSDVTTPAPVAAR
jgi:hypothetical protein